MSKRKRPSTSTRHDIIIQLCVLFYLTCTRLSLLFKETSYLNPAEGSWTYCFYNCWLLQWTLAVQYSSRRTKEFQKKTFLRTGRGSRESIDWHVGMIRIIRNNSRKLNILLLLAKFFKIIFQTTGTPSPSYGCWGGLLLPEVKERWIPTPRTESNRVSLSPRLSIDLHAETREHRTPKPDNGRGCRTNQAREAQTSCELNYSTWPGRSPRLFRVQLNAKTWRWETDASN